MTDHRNKYLNMSYSDLLRAIDGNADIQTLNEILRIYGDELKIHPNKEADADLIPADDLFIKYVSLLAYLYKAFPLGTPYAGLLRNIFSWKFYGSKILYLRWQRLFSMEVLSILHDLLSEKRLFNGRGSKQLTADERNKIISDFNKIIPLPKRNNILTVNSDYYLKQNHMVSISFSIIGPSTRTPIRKKGCSALVFLALLHRYLTNDERPSDTEFLEKVLESHRETFLISVHIKELRKTLKPLIKYISIQGNARNKWSLLLSEDTEFYFPKKNYFLDKLFPELFFPPSGD